jgi:hypothetical protein
MECGLNPYIVDPGYGVIFCWDASENPAERETYLKSRLGAFFKKQKTKNGEHVENEIVRTRRG